MLTKTVLFSALVAFVFADVSHLRLGQASGPEIRIIRQESDIQPDGSYQYAYETENGIAAQEQAQVRVLGPEQVEKVAQGSAQWTSPEGEQISFTYVADGNGYQPQGSHLPVAPPIPVAIQRALEWIAAHPAAEERQINQPRFNQRF